MEQKSITIYVIVAMIVSIWVTRCVRRSLVLRSVSRPLGLPVAVTKLAELILWVSGTLAILTASYHPLSILILMLFLASVITNSMYRYREDKGTLHRCLMIALQQGTPLVSALEPIGKMLRSGLAERVNRCVRLLKEGHGEFSSIVRSRLPVESEIVALVSAESQPQTTSIDSRFFKLWSSGHIDRDLWKLSSQMSHQLLYLALLMIMCSCFGAWASLVLTPLLEDFSDGINIKQSDLVLATNLERMSNIAIYVTCLFCGWLLAILLIPKLPSGLMRLIPWFGRAYMDQQRVSLLRALARGTKSGLADYEILKAAGQTSRARWIASRCQKSMALLDDGYSFDQAIERSGLIRPNERNWLLSSSANNLLPIALDSLASSIHRRLVYRWQLRMTWLVPLILVLSGIYIFAIALMTFGFLRDLVLLLA